MCVPAYDPHIKSIFTPISDDGVLQRVTTEAHYSSNTRAHTNRSIILFDGRHRYSLTHRSSLKHKSAIFAIVYEFIAICLCESAFFQSVVFQLFWYA